ncbi:MAG: ankyrin repeat domain-containing protein [Gammaproteobacteria bacterium]
MKHIIGALTAILVTIGPAGVAGADQEPAADISVQSRAEAGKPHKGPQTVRTQPRARREHPALSDGNAVLNAAAPQAENAGWTPLMWAADKGDLAMLASLLASGSGVDTRDTNGATALSHAAMAGHTAVVEQLIKHGAVIDLADNWGATPLMYAVKSGNLAVAGLLIKSGANVNRPLDKSLMSPLMMAAFRGDNAMIKLLLDNKADIEQTNSASETALMMAINRQRIESVKLLLKRGADVLRPRSSLGNSVLHYAAMGDSVELVQALLAQEARMDTQNAYGLTPAMVASARGKAGIVGLLIDAGADIDLAGNPGRNTALSVAAGNDHVDIIKLLTGNGAMTDTRDKLGATALIWAVGREHTESARALLSAGANPDIQDNAGRTALMIAADRGSQTIVDLLLDSGADVNIKDNAGQTAMDYAGKKGRSILFPSALSKTKD